MDVMVMMLNICRRINNNNAGMLYSYFFNKYYLNKFTENFNEISKNIPLSSYEISKSIKILKQNMLIDVFKEGMPSKNFYKLKRLNNV